MHKSQLWKIDRFDTTQLLLCYFYIIFIFIILHCPLSGPDLIYISLLIIPCIIYYVTIKKPWTFCAPGSYITTNTTTSDQQHHHTLETPTWLIDDLLDLLLQILPALDEGIRPALPDTVQILLLQKHTHASDSLPQARVRRKYTKHFKRV